MKRKIISGAVIVMCLAVISFGTLAYFTAEDTARNVITSGDIEIELLEWADEEKTEAFPEDGVTGVMPGTSVTKIVEVKNVGDNPAYIRVHVDKSVTLEGDKEGSAEPISLDFDDEKWLYNDGDGFYYYKETLAPGNVTASLFSKVIFSESMGNSYQNSTANIVVQVQATQVANNGTNALNASGWPAMD